MRRASFRHRAVVFSLAAILAAQLDPRAALACYACFGDPDSPMTKGAVMGVYVLGGVIVTVLIGVAGTALFWMQRGRRLARGVDGSPSEER